MLFVEYVGNALNLVSFLVILIGPCWYEAMGSVCHCLKIIL